MGNDLVKQTIITGLTKYPRLELFGRYSGAVAGGLLIGYAACYCVMKGYYIPDKDTVSLVVQVLIGIALSGFATRMGFTSLATSENTVVANTIHAAATGQIPEAIAARATAAQAEIIATTPATIAPIPPVKPS